jgi:hypothetical protein
VTLPDIFPAVAAVALVFGVSASMFIFRARVMRMFATRCGFQYRGPVMPKLGFPSLPKFRSPFLPASVHLNVYPANQIRQIWNVIEGQHGGVSLLIFDSIIGTGKGTCATFIAWHSKQNPFGNNTSTETAINLGEWTGIYRIPWLQVLPWTMSIRRVDHHLDKLRLGSTVRA